MALYQTDDQCLLFNSSVEAERFAFWRWRIGEERLRNDGTYRPTKDRRAGERQKTHEPLSSRHSENRGARRCGWRP